MKTNLPGNYSPSPLISLTAACGGNSDKRSQIIQMRLYRLVSCIIISTFISGCAYGFYPISVSRDDHKSETRKDLADSLIGESQESVVEKIGRPNQILVDGKQQYMIYEHHSSAYMLVMFLYLPVAIQETHETDTLHCLKIDLDANNLVADYQFKSTAYYKRNRPFLWSDRTFKCPTEYWKEEVWQSFDELPVPYSDQQTLEELTISNLDQKPQADLSMVNCISSGTRQCVERSQCDTPTTKLNSIPDTVSCFSCGKRQWVERSQCD